MSILGKSYKQGYRDGLGQAEQANYDDAHELGRHAGYRQARIDRAVYWLIGLAMGGGAAWWLS